MDEVKAMTRAGETAGKAVAASLDALRRAGQAGAEVTAKAAHAAEHKLAEHGVAPQELAGALAETAQVAKEEVAKTTRRTRRRLARTAKHTRKELAAAAKVARKQAKKAPKIDPKRAKEEAKLIKKGLLTEAEAFKARARVGAQALATTKAEMKAAAKAAKEEAGGRKRRRWPFLIAIAGIAAGVAYMRRAMAEPPAPVTPMPRTAPESTEAKPAAKDTAAAKPSERNGQPKPQKPATKQG
jgi:hypothetical protein